MTDMTPFIEAATIAGYGLTSLGLVWIVWRMVVAYKGETFIWYHYEDEEENDGQSTD